jgi:hypothetical protein
VHDWPAIAAAIAAADGLQLLAALHMLLCCTATAEKCAHVSQPAEMQQDVRVTKQVPMTAAGTKSMSSCFCQLLKLLSVRQRPKMAAGHHNIE